MTVRRADIAHSKRVYSDIEFPYTDLEQAAELAQAINDIPGGSCQDKELAAWLDQSAEGGTYKARRSAARMFGLVEVRAGTLVLTTLGRDIADTTKARVARAEAFLRPESLNRYYRPSVDMRYRRQQRLNARWNWRASRQNKRCVPDNAFRDLPSLPASSMLPPVALCGQEMERLTERPIKTNPCSKPGAIRKATAAAMAAA